MSSCKLYSYESKEQSSNLLLDFAIIGILGFRPCLKPLPYFYLFQDHLCILNGACSLTSGGFISVTSSEQSSNLLLVFEDVMEPK